MNRLQSITALRDATAMSALNYAIETIRDDLAKWGNSMEAEEKAYALNLLGKLIDMQVETDREAVRVGTLMSHRLSDNPTPTFDREAFDLRARAEWEQRT